MVLIKAIGTALIAATPALCCIGHGNPGAEDYQSRLKSFFAHRGGATSISSSPEAVTTTLAVTKTITKTVTATFTPTTTSLTPLESGRQLIPTLGDSEEWLEALESQQKTLTEAADPKYAHLQASMELLIGLYEQNITQDQGLRGVVNNMTKTIRHRLDMVKSRQKHGKHVDSVGTLLATAEKLLQLRMESLGQKWYDFDITDEVVMPGWPTSGGISAHDKAPVPTASEIQDEKVLEDSHPSQRNFTEAEMMEFAFELRNSVSLGIPIRRKPKPEMKALQAAFYGRQFKTARPAEKMKADCSRFDRDWSFMSLTSDTETPAVEVFEILNNGDQEMILDATFCDTYVPSTAEADAMHNLLTKLWQEQGDDLKIPEDVGEGCGCGTCIFQQLQWAKNRKQPLFWDAWKAALLEEHSRAHPKNITIDVLAPHLHWPQRFGENVVLSMTFSDVNATSSLAEKCADPSFHWEEQQWHFTGWRGITTTHLMRAEIRATLKSIVCQTGVPVMVANEMVSIWDDASKHWERYIYTEPKSSGWCATGYMMDKHREKVRRDAFLI